MEHTLIPTLALSLIAAMFLALLVTRLRLPNVVGYLLAGILVGPHTPGFTANGPLAAELADVGVMLLMFSVGSHISLSDLRKVWRTALPGALLKTAIVTGLGYALGAWWHWPTASAVIFGLALSCASTVVLLRTFETLKIHQQPENHLAVSWLLVEDLACIFALVLIPVLSTLQTGNPQGHNLHKVVFALGEVFLKIGAFTALMLFLGTRGVRWLLHEVLRHESRELFTISLVATSIGIAYLAAIWFHVSFALGAFLAGVVINGLPIRQRVNQNLQPIQDTFSVLFFVSVGLLFDPRTLLHQPGKVLLVLAIIIPGKALLTYFILRFQKFPTSSTASVAIGLAQIGEFSFILASLGIRYGLLSPLEHQLILAGAILSIALNQMVFNALPRPRVRSAVGTPPG